MPSGGEPAPRDVYRAGNVERLTRLGVESDRTLPAWCSGGADLVMSAPPTGSQTRKSQRFERRSHW